MPCNQPSTFNLDVFESIRHHNKHVFCVAMETLVSGGTYCWETLGQQGSWKMETLAVFLAVTHDWDTWTKKVPAVTRPVASRWALDLIR